MPGEDTSKWSLPTKRAFELLTHEWQPLDELTETVSELVPPGKGLRKYEQQTEARLNARPTTAPHLRRELTEDQKIKVGQREIARAAIRNHVQAGRAEKTEIDGRRMIRLTVPNLDGLDACPTCRRPFEKALTKKPPSPALGRVVSMEDFRNRKADQRERQAR